MDHLPAVGGGDASAAVETRVDEAGSGGRWGRARHFRGERRVCDVRSQRGPILVRIDAGPQPVGPRARYIERGRRADTIDQTVIIVQVGLVTGCHPISKDGRRVVRWPCRPIQPYSRSKIKMLGHNLHSFIH